MHWIRSNEENWASDGPRFAFAIQTPDGELVGMCEINVDYLHFAGLDPGDANVSYGLYPRFRGRGLATSALLTVRDFMVAKGVKRAVIRIEPENVASVRLANRAGYSQTGVVFNGVGTEYLMFVDDLTKVSDREKGATGWPQCDFSTRRMVVVGPPPLLFAVVTRLVTLQSQTERVTHGV